MPTVEEKAAFAKRLRNLMRRTPEKPKGATDLARHFNLRHSAGDPISTQTAHKWLTGRTIPTRDKLQTLAEWFDVDAHWLHYGPGANDAKAVTPKPITLGIKYPPRPETLELASKIEALNPHHRYLLEELVAQFYGDIDEG